jgi:uncharacterized protein YjdB
MRKQIGIALLLTALLFTLPGCGGGGGGAGSNINGSTNNGTNNGGTNTGSANNGGSTNGGLNSGIQNVTLSPADATLTVGQTAHLTAAATDANNQAVTVPAGNLQWVSSKPAIASVSAAGVVTGAASGAATITVTESSSGKSATATVTVVLAGNTGNGVIRIQ